MLKKDITYEDFDGEKVTETFWFHLMKSELVELGLGYEKGLDEWVRNVIKTDDKKALLKQFTDLILLSYGERTPDGKRFVKTAEAREAFHQSLAFDALFVELASLDDALVEFVKGILPKDLQEEVAKLDAAEAMKLKQPNIQPAENLRAPQGGQLAPPPPSNEVASNAG
jgi:hypothetical protein